MVTFEEMHTYIIRKLKDAGYHAESSKSQDSIVFSVRASTAPVHIWATIDNDEVLIATDDANNDKDLEIEVKQYLYGNVLSI